MTDYQYQVFTLLNIESHMEENDQIINNNIYDHIYTWKNFIHLYDFSFIMDKRIIILMSINNVVIGCAFIRYCDTGITSGFDHKFPTIKAYLEDFHIVDFTVDKLKLLFQFIYDTLGEVFLVETDYMRTTKIYINELECLPIVPFYPEGCTLAVYPKTMYNDVNFNTDLSDADYSDLSDIIMQSMDEIQTKHYPALDNEGKIVEW